MIQYYSKLLVQMNAAHSILSAQTTRPQNKDVSGLVLAL